MPVLESLFNKVAGLKTCSFIKKRPEHRYFSCEICEVFKNTCFYGTPPVAAYETKHIHASAADLLHIKIGNRDW